MNDPTSSALTRRRYRLELTPSELKVTYTALKSLLSDYGHDEEDVRQIVSAR